MSTDRTPRHFGARVARRQDDRLLRGQGQYVADINPPRVAAVKFVRSYEAHAAIAGIDVADALGAKSVLAAFVGKDFADSQIRCVSSYPGFQESAQPVLATDRVRYVGEAVAMVIADDRIPRGGRSRTCRRRTRTPCLPSWTPERRCALRARRCTRDGTTTRS